jgi:hypothetical protein
LLIAEQADEAVEQLHDAGGKGYPGEHVYLD